MRPNFGLGLGLVLLGVASGCGSGTQHPATRAEVKAYAALANDVSAASAGYASAAQATADVGACQTGHAAYDAQVRPTVEQMQQQSSRMDETLNGMRGQMGAADLGCGADAMKAELDHHAAAACTSADMAANHAEATRHAQAMGDWAEHQTARCTEMENQMTGGTGGSGSGTTGVCAKQPDGSYTLGGAHP